jgi:hypothetical protein
MEEEAAPVAAALLVLHQKPVMVGPESLAVLEQDQPLPMAEGEGAIIILRPIRHYEVSGSTVVATGQLIQPTTEMMARQIEVVAAVEVPQQQEHLMVAAAALV